MPLWMMPSVLLVSFMSSSRSFCSEFDSDAKRVAPARLRFIRAEAFGLRTQGQKVTDTTMTAKTSLIIVVIRRCRIFIGNGAILVMAQSESESYCVFMTHATDLVVLMLFDFGMRIARIHGPDTRAFS